MRYRQQKKQPIPRQVGITEQPVHALDAVLWTSPARQISPDRRWRQPSAFDDAFYCSDHRTQSRRVHNGAAPSDELTFHLSDAHPCGSLSFDNPKRSRFGMRVAI
jgi:hypothetical protein